jgi:hypothetical protein
LPGHRSRTETQRRRRRAKREAQIKGVIEATAGMYGDVQGIAGKALDEIDALTLPMIESFDTAASEARGQPD